jgi:hypothetical protein
LKVAGPPAWEQVDYETVWTEFEGLYGFRAGTDPARWPAISEPPGSVTFDLSPCVDGSAAAEWARHTVNHAVIWALAGLVGKAPLVVLDWQHPTYRFWPDRLGFGEPPFGPGVTPFPDGDYYAFFDETLQTGSFGHPWERSLCIIGPELVDSLGPLLSALLPIKRRQ